MVRGLISERSYPWAVEPAGLNGSIRHRLSGEGSGGELECMRWMRMVRTSSVDWALGGNQSVCSIAGTTRRHGHSGSAYQ